MRGADYGKLNKGLGLSAMSVPDTHEDTATMGANAATRMIDRNGLDLIHRWIQQMPQGKEEIEVFDRDPGVGIKFVGLSVQEIGRLQADQFDRIVVAFPGEAKAQRLIAGIRKVLRPRNLSPAVCPHLHKLHGAIYGARV